VTRPRRRSPERRECARATSTPAPGADAARKRWLPRIVRVASIALTLIGLAGIGIAAGKPGAVSGPLALLGSAFASSSASQSAPALATSAPDAPWLATPRSASHDPAPSGPSSTNPTATAPSGVATASRPAPSGATASSAAPSDAATAQTAPCTSEASAGATSTSAAAPTSPALTGGVVVLNRADVNELMRLPGIGRKRAQAIIELRERLGRFRRPTDLLRVRGIGTRSLQRLLPLLVVDAPTAPASSQ
jgi:competence protein ComEA